MRQPTIAVIAFPFLYTTAIAHVLEAQGRYAVEAPDIVTDDWVPNEPLDVIVASLPVPRTWGRMFITLPEDFADPVDVSAGELTVLVHVDAQSPLQGVVTLVDLVTADPSVNVIDALHGIKGISGISGIKGISGHRTPPTH